MGLSSQKLHVNSSTIFVKLTHSPTGKQIKTKHRCAAETCLGLLVDEDSDFGGYGGHPVHLKN